MPDTQITPKLVVLPKRIITPVKVRHDEKKGLGNGGKRFQEAKMQSELGPGSYQDSVVEAISVRSPFKSTSVRFKAVTTANQISPGSYFLCPFKAEPRGDQIFVKLLSSRLGTQQYLPN